MAKCKDCGKDGLKSVPKHKRFCKNKEQVESEKTPFQNALAGLEALKADLENQLADAEHEVGELKDKIVEADDIITDLTSSDLTD